MIALAIAAHRIARVSFEDDVGPGAAGAGKDEAGLPVLGKVAPGVGLIDLARHEPCRAGEAPALQASVRQVQSFVQPGIEQVLVVAHLDPAFGAVGKPERRLVPGHISSY